VKLKVGDQLLDSEFQLEQIGTQDALALTLESRKGTVRNPAYSDCLYILLRALCDARATILSIEVVSKRTQDFDVASRQLAFRYPFQLDTSTDIAKLKGRIGDLQRTIGSESKTRGGGNRTRRLRIVFQTSDFTYKEFKESLGDSHSVLRRRAFVLLWNPAQWPLEEYVAELDEARRGSLGRWSTGARKSGILEGDILLLFQIGRDGRGLIGSGTALAAGRRGVECVFRDGHWDKKNADANYVDIAWSDLVHPDDRFSADHFIHRFPQVPWAHLQGSGTLIPTEVGIELVKEFHEHVNSESLESPEVSDAKAQIDHLAGKVKRGSTTRNQRARANRLSAEQRRIIEIHAMHLAELYLKKQGWSSVVDTSAGNPFDFHCKNSKSEIWVEVKGTTSPGSSVVLTRNEVLHHRSVHPRSSLIIVHSIRLTGKNRTVADEGTLIEISPWKIREADLNPIGFDYTTGL